MCGKSYFNVAYCRVLDPHGQLTSRRRSASVNSRDHHLGSLAEDPAEEDQVHETDSETVNSGGCAQFNISLFFSIIRTNQVHFLFKIYFNNILYMFRRDKLFILRTQLLRMIKVELPL